MHPKKTAIINILLNDYVFMYTIINTIMPGSMRIALLIAFFLKSHFFPSNIIS